MTAINCFTREELLDFVQGKLPSEACHEIASHLDDCDLCEDTVVGLDRFEDTLIEALGLNPHLNSEDLESPTPEYQSAVAAIRRQEFAIDGSVNERPVHPADLATDDGKLPDNPIQIGDYVLEKQIARGGMGSVFLARHTRLQRAVAVKILPHRKMNNSSAIARFDREIRIVGGLDHPSIVQATDAGETDDGTHYLVMEHISGFDLSRIVRMLGSVQPANAAELVRQAAIGLQYVHDHDVIHRDVKPSNLMLSDEGNVKILDLGLATLGGLNGMVDELTTVGQLMGTLDYMAPEQFGGEQGIDQRTDVYGLGATLYKLLTGVAPYSHPNANTPLKKLRAMAIEAPTPIEKRRDDLPAELCDVVAKAIASEPADRFQSTVEMAEALAEHCQGNGLQKLALQADQVFQQTSQVKENQKIDLSGLVTDCQEKQKFTASDAPHNSPVKTSSQFRWFRWVVAATLLTLLGWGGWQGITIYLDTVAGQLIIKSEIEDISVSVIEDGEPAKDIRVEHGSEATRLWAGKYRIEINGLSDGLVIENQNFELRRGEKVVARISRRAAAGVATESAGVDAADESDNELPTNEGFMPNLETSGPTYQGISLEQYVDDQIMNSVRHQKVSAGYRVAVARMAPRTEPKKLIQMIEGHLNQRRQEVSLKSQFSLISTLACLCYSDEAAELVMDRLFDVVRNAEVDPKSFKQLQAAQVCFSYFPIEAQKLEAEMLRRLNDESSQVKIVVLRWLIGSEKRETLELSPWHWSIGERLPINLTLESSQSLLAAMRSSNELVALTACYLVAKNLSELPEVLDEFKSLLKSDSQMLRVAAIEFVIHQQPTFEQLPMLMLEDVKRRKVPPTKLVELYPENPKAFDAIKAFLADPIAGSRAPIKSAMGGRGEAGMMGGMGMGAMGAGGRGMGERGGRGMGAMEAGGNSKSNWENRRVLILELGGSLAKELDRRFRLHQGNQKNASMGMGGGMGGMGPGGMGMGGGMNDMGGAMGLGGMGGAGTGMGGGLMGGEENKTSEVSKPELTNQQRRRFLPLLLAELEQAQSDDVMAAALISMASITSVKREDEDLTAAESRVAGENSDQEKFIKLQAEMFRLMAVANSQAKKDPVAAIQRLERCEKTIERSELDEALKEPLGKVVKRKIQEIESKVPPK